MPFLENLIFPDDLAMWAVGGKGYRTVVVETRGGNEQRTGAWSYPRGSWDISACLRVADWQQATYNQRLLLDFFHQAEGMFHGFRFRDFADSTDGGGGVFVGTGAANKYQMLKRRVAGAFTKDTVVNKPVSPVVVTGMSGSVDYTTGVITSTTTPTAWTGSYHVPVRFNTDQPMLGLDASGALYEWHGLKLIEIRDLT